MVSVIGEKRRVENGDCSLVPSSPKFKRRKFFAVRDFPPGCGPNVEPLSVEKDEVIGDKEKMGVPLNDVNFVKEMASDCQDVEGNGIFGKSANTELGNEELAKAQGMNDLENPKFSNDMHNMDEESKLKDEKLVMVLNSTKVSIEMASESQNNGVLDLVVPRCESRSGVIVEGNSPEKMCLLEHLPIPPNFVWKERKYPPRKRVSATRDFPRGCGRNVHPLDEAGDKNLVGEKAGSCTLEVVNKSDGNHVGEHLENDHPFVEKNSAVNSGEGDNKLECKHDSCEYTSAEDFMLEPEAGKNLEVKGQVGLCDIDNNNESGGVAGIDDMELGGSGVVKNKEILVYKKDKYRCKKPVFVCGDKIEVGEQSSPQEDIPVGNEGDLVLVYGLMAAPHCPWRQGKDIDRSSPSPANLKRTKRKKNENERQGRRKCVANKMQVVANKSQDRAVNLEGRSAMRVCSETEINGVSSDDEDLSNDFRLVPRRPEVDVSLPPFGVGSSSESGARTKMREMLRLFHAVIRKITQGEETKLKGEMKTRDQENVKKRIDLRASAILKDHGKCVFTGKKSILGSVPGIEVGDFFNYRIELSIIGLHRPPQAGIDTLKQGGKLIATSIVASGGYANDVDSSDVLIYTGQGGNACGNKKAEDQKLERGNLALKNSIDEKNFVRVIRGFKESKPSETGDGKAKVVATYTYDGLYTVGKYWPDVGPHGKLVYKFELRRLAGQPELSWREIKKSKKFKVREGRCVDDISEGKEKFPVCAINTIDDERPPSFRYITEMMYPNWCQPIPPKGCDCKSGCSDSEHCACAVKNGGEIPYNYNGAIVEAKRLVYECGPSCKCPPSCHNRVSQHGFKFPLEIFKTETRGWGVRSLSSIPSGSFICEYIGELLDDKEAEQRAGSDEYLFDIGQNFNDLTLWDGLLEVMPHTSSSSNDAVESIGFTIDAAKYGNIGRFINHSCSPNLYAQNVLYDHEDKRIPHIMLFAAENIPPLQELTYHYNYTIDEVFDANGNIKEKRCYCGSSECTGRLY